MFASFVRKALYAVLVVALCVPPMVVSAQDTAIVQEADPLGLGPGITPEGRWRSQNRDSRYDVTLCGEDGVSLCGKLIWIRPRNRNDRNERFVGKWVVNEIERVRPAEWQGTLNVYGTEYSGSVKMVSNDEMTMTGCVLILCETYTYVRLRNADGSRVDVSQQNTDDE